MKLDDEYLIGTDPYQFVLQRKSIGQRGKSKGKEVISPVSYHSRLSDVLHKYLKVQLLRETNSTTEISELIKKVEKLEDKIDQIGEGVDFKLWNKNK